LIAFFFDSILPLTHPPTYPIDAAERWRPTAPNLMRRATAADLSSSRLASVKSSGYVQYCCTVRLLRIAVVFPFTTICIINNNNKLQNQGWDEGVLQMSLGEKAMLHITSDYGYGARGAGAVIPPHADLNFEVELLEINQTA
jgi:hypothetical protein